MVSVEKSQSDGLAFAINVHARLVSDFPKTPYQSWCQWVHNNKALSVADKWHRILSWDVNPSDYTNATLFSADWQLWKFLAKFSEGEQPTEDAKLFARQKFLQSEDACRSFNQHRISGELPRGYHLLNDGIRKICDKVLGDVKDFFTFVESMDVSTRTLLIRTSTEYCRTPGLVVDDDISVVPKFGPGVSVSPFNEGESISSQQQKLIHGSVTASCAYLANWLSSIWHIPNAHIVAGDVLTYVLKQVGEARTICFGPSMNMLVQKLIGLYIRHKLKVVLKIDLSDQSRNRRTAELGSLCDSYSSSDLTSASDLNAYMFVLDSLSLGWFTLLDDARSKQYYDRSTSQWTPYEKFSTMGNGFTFELETLLFAAIVLSATELWGRRLSLNEMCVYGDDLLFPKEHYFIVQQALIMCGHKPNYKKSFHSGSFRESCGGDYFCGWDVTPFKLKRLHLNEAKTMVNLYNGLLIVSSRCTHGAGVSDWYTRALSFIKRWLLSHYARMSEGPYEEISVSTYNDRMYQRSNRWLWSDNPTHNVVWSRYIQCRVPKYLLMESAVIRSVKDSEDPRKRRYAVFDVTIEYARYAISCGFEPTQLATKVERFRRNPMLIGPR